MIRIHLLGYPTVFIDDEPVTGFVSLKTVALLAYVVETQQTQARDKLVGLFWGDMPEAKAKSSLRTALYNIQQLLPDVLEITRKSVRYVGESTVTVDAHQFSQLTSLPDPAIEQLREAMAWYQADFLEGVHIPAAPEFEEWLIGQRERFRQTAVTILTTLATHDMAEGNLPQAAIQLRQLLQLEPWRETAHRDLMQLQARLGDYNAALRQYEQCAQMLADELGIEPMPETRRLYERITQLRLRPPQDHVPLALEALVGRKHSLAELRRLLADPQTRLITVLGMGGIGKTRLALAIAADQHAHFMDGVHFISLESETNPALLPVVLSKELGLSLTAVTEAESALLAYFASREMLLILDNFEQLLPGGAAFLSKILSQTQHIKLLVTSRTRLHLRWERVMPLAGLPYPDSPTAPNLAAYSALALFVQAAQRMRPDLDLTAQLPAVWRVCQLVDGLPLAIELAAVQTAVMPVAEIVAQIEASADALTAVYQDISPRHRSLRAVFNQSWEHLSIQEQETLGSLSVFQGGFTLAAVKGVLGEEKAVLHNLTSLVGKSLVRLAVPAQGIYILHPLLREFAAEKVADPPALTRRWALTMLHLLAAEYDRLRGDGYMPARAALDAVWENVRAAWLWAVDAGETAVLQSSLAPLTLYCDFANRFIELTHLLTYADAHRLTAADTLFRARVQVTAAHYLLNMGENGRGRACFAHSQPTLQAHQDDLYLAEWYRQQAQHYRDLDIPIADALTLAKTSCQFAQQSGDTWAQGASLLVLGNLYFEAKSYTLAETTWTEGLVLYQTRRSLWGELAMLLSLAGVAEARGSDARALTLFAQGLAQARNLQSDALIGAALFGLGTLSFKLAQYSDAHSYFTEYLQIALANGNLLEQEVGEQWLNKLPKT
jgi:DNA-binding SARP family transcriptional activator/predicted ATPase